VTKAPQRVPALVPVDGPALETLRDILTELRGLRADLMQRRTPAPTLNRTDRARLAALFPAIAGVYGSEPFTCRDLVDDEAGPALRLVVAGLDARQLGSLFARAVGVVVDGYVLERAGSELHTRLWRVFRSRELMSDRGSLRPPLERV